MIIGGKEFDTENKSFIMGVLNVTPDSFSDGGRFYSKRTGGRLLSADPTGTRQTEDRYYINHEAALDHVERMIYEGADIIDIGGESTRPGYQMVSYAREIERVVPIIEDIKANFDIPLSLDTYKPEVAKAGIEAGIDMINDIWGLKYDERMAKIIAESGVPCVLMHNREKIEYNDFVEDVISDLKETLDIAEKAGISKDKIIIDPGIGFAKSYEQNLEIMDRLDELCKLDYPVLLGSSRKSVIGLTLDLQEDERVEGTIATTVIGRMRGARFFRVHDVMENLRALKMTEAIMNRGK